MLASKIHSTKILVSELLRIKKKNLRLSLERIETIFTYHETRLHIPNSFTKIKLRHINANVSKLLKYFLKISNLLQRLKYIKRGTLTRSVDFSDKVVVVKIVKM